MCLCSPTVYNPVSLAQFFRNKGKFNNYWFQTGIPEFLLDLIKEKKFNCAAALTEPVSAAFFNAFEISNLDPMILLYQTGYLTIEKAGSVYESDHAFILHAFPEPGGGIVLQ